MSLVPKNHVLLLRPTLKNIKYPIQSPFLALHAHVRTNRVAVYLRCLGDHANNLLGVLLDVRLSAGPDEVYLEVRGLLASWC